MSTICSFVAVNPPIPLWPARRSVRLWRSLSGFGGLAGRLGFAGLRSFYGKRFPDAAAPRTRWTTTSSHSIRTGSASATPPPQRRWRAPAGPPRRYGVAAPLPRAARLRRRFAGDPVDLGADVPGYGNVRTKIAGVLRDLGLSAVIRDQLTAISPRSTKTSPDLCGSWLRRSRHVGTSEPRSAAPKVGGWSQSDTSDGSPHRRIADVAQASTVDSSYWSLELLVPRATGPLSDTGLAPARSTTIMVKQLHIYSNVDRHAGGGASPSR